MDPYNHSTPTSTKLPILDTRKFEQWKFRIQQYLQHEHYALWEVIEFGDSYKAPLEEPGKGLSGEGSTKKKGRTVAITAEDMQKRRNDVKARTTLLLALPDEHHFTASTRCSASSLSHDTVCVYIATHPNGSQIKYEDITQIDDDDIEEMDIKWNLALLIMRADRFWKKTGKKIAIQGSDVAYWSYIAEEDENHALVAEEEEVPIKYALMAKSSSSSDNEVYDDSYCSKLCRKNTENLNNKIIKLNEELSDCETDLYNYKRGLSQVEARLVEFKENKIKFCERIRVLERDIELKDNKIENLRNELEELKNEKDSIDFKIEKFENSAKDLDCLFGNQRSVKDKTGLPEFVDNTVTDYSRPTPSIDVPRDVSDSISFFKHRGSVGNVLSKPMISFVKETGYPSVLKVINIKNSRKPTMKYVKMYRNTSQSPKVMSNNFSAPIIEEWDSENESEVDFTVNETVRPSFEQAKFDKLNKEVLGKDFVMQNKACYNCGSFEHLKFDCTQITWVNKGKIWTRVNHDHDNMKNPSTLNSAHPKLTSCVKPAHSHVKRPFERKTTVKNKVWVPTARTKFPTVGLKVLTAKPTVAAVKGNREKHSASAFFRFGNQSKINVDQGSNLMDNIDDKGYWDSGCSRHMTGNISYLSEYEPYDGGYVSFGHGGGKIIGKGTIKIGKLDVLFTDSEYLVLGKDFKLDDDSHVLLRTPRQQNMYSIDLKNIVPHKNLTCLIAKASEDESMLWHRRLGHLNFKTMNKLVRNNLVTGLPSKSFENNLTCVACLKGKQHKASCKTKLVNYVSKPLHTLHMDFFGPTFVSSLNHKWYCLAVTGDFSRFTLTFFLKSKDETSSILRNFITEIENLKDLKVKIIRCDNGGEFRNREMDELCSKKGIKREFSNARTLQQNGVAERRNRTLIEAARTMLANAKLPITFWVEVVSTACYVQNRVLVNKSQNKTPYELVNGRSPAIGFLRPFGCHVMILNTLDHLGKFDAKGDEENQPIEKGTSPNWLFDIDSLTKSMNYVPVVAGISSTNISGTKEDALKENVSSLRYIALLNWFHEAQMGTSNDSMRNSDAKDDSQVEQDSNTDVSESSGSTNPTATSKDHTADQVEPVLSSTMETKVPTAPSLGNAMSFKNRLEDVFGDTTALVSLNKVENDLSNMETDIQISPTPSLRLHKVHPKSQIIGLVDTPVQTRQKTKNMEEQSFIATIHQKTNPELIQFCLFSYFLSQEEPKKIFDALKDPSWVEAMQEELLQDERGIVIRNKARLVAQGYTQEKGIDYEEVFASVARILSAITELHDYHSFPTKFTREFEALMHDKFKMSAMGELNFFLGLQVLQKKDVIFLSQDKYVVDILNKFGFLNIRSMIRSLMYLTASRPDIMFAVCACARHQVTPKECHLHAVKRIFWYLKGHPKLGLWYPKESFFDLVAYSDSDYGGATQDRKSTTKGSEYVAAASGCGQVLWIQKSIAGL
ncbi:putative ribonuclease H-like domain-containing protein [Tanacetum coccineum]|uniref:Ribonuclease H-like domain-containing protein n=1 Tax=Tanacetum coccineum TaxID=301880 RepID=A0ABQ5DH05_9ASTR